ncbi:MAG: GNAT family N-acetyltransferase [Clostridiaceae bacterium]|nr:GNAT family N-acetyltransferase [Clostridiaceae bacterium]
MRIETARLVLRDYCPEDMDTYYRMKTDPTVWKDSTEQPVGHWGQAAKALGDILSAQLSTGTGYRAVCLRGGPMIGEAGILRLSHAHNRCRIGCNLLPEYWNRGYGTEIFRLLLRLAFPVLQLERAEAAALADNIGACRALEKAGFQREGLLRNRHCQSGRYRDLCVYGIVSREYAASPPRWGE